MPFPIIVLEGADCSGKTTLGQFLSKRWDAAYIHATYRFPKAMFNYHTAILNKAIKLSEKQPVIVDRWWPSELLYAEAFRNGSPWPMIGRMLDRVAIKQNVIYVGCIPSNANWQQSTFENRAAQGGEMFDKNDKVAELYRQWASSMANRHDFMLYDVVKQGSEMGRLADSIEERYGFLKAAAIKHWDDPDIKVWAGNSVNPEMLIIGEKANPGYRREVWPFFEHDNASLFVTNALENAGIHERQLAWYNPISHDETTNPALLKGLVENLKPKHVVSLGATADKICQIANLDVEHHKIRHPSYLMRFKRETGLQELTDAFKEIVA